MNKKENKTNDKSPLSQIDEAVYDFLSLNRISTARVKSIPTSDLGIVFERTMTEIFKSSNEYFDFVKVLIDFAPYPIKQETLLDLMRHLSNCKTEDDWL